MMKKHGCGDCLTFLGAVEFHEDFSCRTGETVLDYACMDVMATSQEIGSEARVVQQSLQNRSLIARLTHVPNTTSAADGTRVLVSIVLDVDLGGRVFSPNGSPIYQMLVDVHGLDNLELPGTHQRLQTCQKGHGVCLMCDHR
jgi:hypothetical protein